MLGCQAHPFLYIAALLGDNASVALFPSSLLSHAPLLACKQDCFQSWGARETLRLQLCLHSEQAMKGKSAFLCGATVSDGRQEARVYSSKLV